MLIETLGNYKCDTAVNGQEAIDKALKKNKKNGSTYKLIIMDLNMPVMDGRQATS